jgi:WD40 repeat protein
VWEVSPPSSSPVLTLHTHETEVPTIAFSPDGRQLMTGGVAENETKVWDLASLSFPR